MSNEQLEAIDAALRRGVLPQDIAREMGISRSALIFQLLNSGKRIATFRRLEATGSMSSPTTQEREKAAA